MTILNSKTVQIWWLWDFQYHKSWVSSQHDQICDTHTHCMSGLFRLKINDDQYKRNETKPWNENHENKIMYNIKLTLLFRQMRLFYLVKSSLVAFSMCFDWPILMLVHVIWTGRRMSKLVLNVKYLLLLSFLMVAEFYTLGHIQGIIVVY